MRDRPFAEPLERFFEPRDLGERLLTQKRGVAASARDLGDGESNAVGSHAFAAEIVHGCRASLEFPRLDEREADGGERK